MMDSVFLGRFMRIFGNLKRSGQLLCIAVLGCSSLLGLMLMHEYRHNADLAATSAHDLLQFIEVVRTLNVISAERGPTNALVAAQGDRPDLVSKLTAIRQKSDLGLASIEQDPTFAVQCGRVRRSLQHARATIDAIVSRPAEARTVADIGQAVAVMVAVIDEAEPLVEDTMHAIASRSSSSVIGAAILIRALSDMRDYAGRMGSALIVPLALKQPMTPEQRASYVSLEGRVLGLHHILRSPIQIAQDPAIDAALADVETRFFGSGLDLLHTVLDAGRDGTYPMDRETFTSSVQPGFRTLEGLRDAVADRARHIIESDGTRARWSFVIVATLTIVMIGLEVVLILAAQKLIFLPLLDAREAILVLASGHIDSLPERPEAIGEMGELFGALTLLKGQIQERNDLDRKNKRLTERLRDLADRDGLTGVLNRGALERVAHSLIMGQAGPDVLGLILFDIDHFKKINDSHGHSAGDTVLRELAARWSDLLPDPMILARFGGEEFAALVPDGRSDDLRATAEVLRQATMRPLRLPGGMLVPVSASFGVAVAVRRPGAWASLVEASDKALYRAKRSGRNMVRCQDDSDAMARPSTAA